MYDRSYNSPGHSYFSVCALLCHRHVSTIIPNTAYVCAGFSLPNPYLMLMHVNRCHCYQCCATTIFRASCWRVRLPCDCATTAVVFMLHCVLCVSWMWCGFPYPHPPIEYVAIGQINLVPTLVDEHCIMYLFHIFVHSDISCWVVGGNSPCHHSGIHSEHAVVGRVVGTQRVSMVHSVHAYVGCLQCSFHTYPCPLHQSAASRWSTVHVDRIHPLIGIMLLSLSRDTFMLMRNCAVYRCSPSPAHWHAVYAPDAVVCEKLSNHTT